jgi:membrane protein DedA with SNARE-associated domain
VLRSVFAIAVANAPTSDGHGGLAEQLISIAFNPTWNTEHRVVIFAAIVVLLFASGVGLPLPEDIPLSLAGFTTIKQANDHFVFGHYLTTFMVVVIPILLGDLVAYWLGRRYGLGLTRRVGFIRRAVTPARLARVQGWFDRYGAFAVFLGRQLAGVRFVTFFTAGSMRVPLSRFVGFDFLGCIVSVPVWLSLGTLASRYGETWLHAAMCRASHMMLLVVVLLVLMLILVTKLRGSAAENEASDA